MAAPAEDLVAEIMSPPQLTEDIYSGAIPITGTAKHFETEKFSKYVLMFQKTHSVDGTGWKLVSNPVWSPISSSSYPKDNALLGTWNTIGLSGSFKLRLVVSDTDGNIAISVRQFDVDNDKPVIKNPSPAIGSTITTIQPVLVYAGDALHGMDSVDMFVNDRLVGSEYDHGNGYATYMPSPGELVTGKNVITVMAIDNAGNKASYTYGFSFDPSEPVSEITNFDSGLTIPGTKRTSVAGRAHSPTLKTWKLEYKKESATAYSTLFTGLKPVYNDAVLGILPVLANGSYRLKLTTVNNALVQKVLEIPFSVDNSVLYGSSVVISNAAQQDNSLVILGTVKSPDFASYKLHMKQTYPVAGAETLLFSGTHIVNEGVLFNGMSRGNGAYDVNLRAYNSAGAILQTAAYSVQMDTALPKVISTSPPPNSFVFAAIQTVSISAIDPEPIRGSQTASGLKSEAVVKINGELHIAVITSDTYSVELPEALPDGSYKTSVTIADNKGNKTLSNYTFVVDTVSPEAAIEGPVSDNIIRGTFAVTGRVFDENIANYQIQVKPDLVGPLWMPVASSTKNMALPGSILGSWNTSALNGWYRMRLVAVDKAGNTSYFPTGAKDDHTAGIRVLVDNRAPAYSNIDPPDKGFLKTVSSVVISGAYDLNLLKTTDNTAGVNSDGIKMKLKGIPVTGLQYLDGRIIYDSGEALADASYSVETHIPDNAGNTTIVKSAFTVDNTVPVADIVLARTTVKAGNKLTIAGKAFDSNMANWTLYQKLATREVYTRLASGSASAGDGDNISTLYTWITPGTTGAYDLKLEVTDKAGNADADTAQIEVDAISNYLDACAITYPVGGSIIKGRVPVIGTAAVPSNFTFYTLSRRLASASVESIIYKGTTPVEGGALASFNTTGLNGNYDLILKRFINPAAPVQHGTPVILPGVKIDNTVPVITSMLVYGGSAMPGFSNNSVTSLMIKVKETGTGLEADRTKLVINGTPFELDFGLGGNATFDPETNSVLVTLPALLDGRYNIGAGVVDKAGNPSSASSMLLTVDTDYLGVPLQPFVEISRPLEGSYQKGSVPIVGSAFDQNILNYKLFARKASTTSFTSIFSGTGNVIDATLGSYRSTDNGPYQLKLVMQDKAMNEPRSTSVNVIIDNIAPVGMMTKLGGIAISTVTEISGSVTIAGKAYDRGGLADDVSPNDSYNGYSIDFGPGSMPASWTILRSSIDIIGSESTEGTLHTWDTEGITPGTYTLRLRVFDKTLAVKEFKKTIKITPGATL